MNEELYLGLDTGGTGTKLVLADRDGRCVARDEVATDPADPARTFARAASAAAAGGRTAPVAVGLACAGIVDTAGLRLGRSPNLPGWEGHDLGAELRRAFPGSRLHVLNDVNAALYGEFREGAGQGCRDLVMLALGTGVGGGVLIDGRLHTGRRYGAGELGHMVLDPDGPPCACGVRGCLEAWAGSVALLRRARERAADGDPASARLRDLVSQRGADLTPRDLAASAAAGDAAARDLFAETGRRLGQAVGNLLNILDPDAVIIGGGVARAGEIVLEPCRVEARRIVLAEAARATPIVPAALGVHAAAVGAAWSAREAGAAG
jgi:glucokinase